MDHIRRLTERRWGTAGRLVIAWLVTLPAATLGEVAAVSAGVTVEVIACI
ncbi:hypothetical protein AB0D57_31520 [Streptomyces sp. NPDC048275]